MASRVAVLTKPEAYIKATDMASRVAVLAKPEVYI